MANFLLIETSASVCSVAISSNDKVLTKYVCNEEMQHAVTLPVFIEQALAYINEHNMKLDAVAISGGPGSYTGLRIGTSTAKGICYAMGLELIAINTLELIAKQAIESIGGDYDSLICPMVDARRMEVYTAIFDSQMNVIETPAPKIIDKDSFCTYKDKTVYFCGSGAAKCKDTINIPRAVYIDDIVPLAEKMAAMATRKFICGQVEDVAYYEPFYLKEFQATTPKTSIVRK